jgi:hypothetical protein
MADSVYVLDGYLPQGYFVYTADAQAQNIVASTTMSVSATAIKGISQTLSGAFTPSLSANRTTDLATDNPSWDYPGATWDTWLREVWGYEGKTLAVNTNLLVTTGKYLGIVRQLDVTTSLGTQNLIVGHTEQAQSTQNSITTAAVTSYVRERNVSKTLESSSTMSVVGVVQRDIVKTIDTTTSATVEGIRAALGVLDAQVSTSLQAQWEAGESATLNSEAAIVRAQWEDGESATLNVSTDLRLVVTGEANQYSEFGISVSAARTRSSSSTLPVIADTDALGGKKSGGAASLLGFATALTVGRVLALDPYNQLRVSQEIRQIKVHPESGMLVVDDEQRLIAVRQEQRIIDVEQETRIIHIPVPPYNQNKERVG